MSHRWRAPKRCERTPLGPRPRGIFPVQAETTRTVTYSVTLTPADLPVGSKSRARPINDHWDLMYSRETRTRDLRLSKPMS